MDDAELYRVIGRMEEAVGGLTRGVKENADLTRGYVRDTSAQIRDVSVNLGAFAKGTEERLTLGDKLLTSLQAEQKRIKVNQRWGYAITGLCGLGIGLYLVTGNVDGTVTLIGSAVAGGIFKLVSNG